MDKIKILKKIRENRAAILTVLSILIVIMFLIAFDILKSHNLKEHHDDKIKEIKIQLEGYFFNELQNISSTLAHNEEIQKILTNQTTNDNSRILSVLNTTKSLFHASIVYVIDKRGIVRACSPYEKGKTLTGLNFSFRPYFKSSIRGIKFIYPALGVVTNKRGVYFSSPVYSKKTKSIIGLTVIKMDMNKVDNILKQCEHPVFLLSQDGIVFSTNIKKWLFYSALPLNEEKLNIIRNSRQFHDKKLSPMPVLFNRDNIKLESNNYYLENESISYTGWKIIYLINMNSSTSLSKEQIYSITIVLITIVLLMTLIYFLLRNIEKRKNAEIKSNKNEEKFRNLFNLAPDAIIITSFNGDLLSYNESFKKTFLFTDSTLENLNVTELFKNRDNDLNKITGIIREQGDIKDYFVQFKDSNGDEIPSTISSKKIIFNEQESIESIIRDMREILKKDNQLQQIQKMEMVGSLSSGIAHNFNNILGGIIGTLSLINFQMEESGTITKEKFGSYIKTLNDASIRAADMVNQMLLVSRKQNLSFITCDLNDCLNRVKSLCENSFDKSIEIKTIPYYEEAYSDIDSNLIEQSILNICINSSHAMTIMKDHETKWGGELIFKVSKISSDSFFTESNPNTHKTGYWEISIKDNGVGIDKNNLSKIFNPFFTTKKNSKGLGLGLSMVYNIIKQHNGYIEVESKLEFGTDVKIYLPVSGSIILEQQETEKNEQKLIEGTGQILIVDDEELMRKTARRILEKCGYDIILASDGEEAVEIIKDTSIKIDAVLLDMVMPKKSGKEAFMEIKAIDSSIPVILASGYIKDKRTEELLNMGVKTFIQKPYTLRELSQTVHDVINDKKS